MAGRVHKVDEVGNALLRLFARLLIRDNGFIFEKERNGTRLHRDASFLFLLPKRETRMRKATSCPCTALLQQV